MQNRPDYKEEFSRFEAMSGEERQTLIRRVARDSFDVDFNRETTQNALESKIESFIRSFNLPDLIRSTARQTAHEAYETHKTSLQAAAEESAKRGVLEGFSALDIDPKSRDEARDFRHDILFVRGIRKTLQESKSKAFGLILVAMFGAGIYGAFSHLVNTADRASNPTPAASAPQITPSANR